MSGVQRSTSGVRVEYALLESRFFPLGNIASLVNCATRCMQNDQCLAATYYSILRTCKLFKERDSPMIPVIDGSATVITMINRPTRKSPRRSNPTCRSDRFRSDPCRISSESDIFHKKPIGFDRVFVGFLSVGIRSGFRRNVTETQ
jgi:hypothetical protein